jgi:phosphoribosylanthranilate isomerase
MSRKFIETVTVTGADDSIDPGDLVSIAKEYPFAEFGILLSKSQEGSKRFPSRDWLQRLYPVWDNNRINNNKMRLSGHLCGQWVRDLCLGIPTFFNDFNGWQGWKMFNRIQLNFHAQNHKVDSKKMVDLFNKYLSLGHIIFQMDGVNENIFSWEQPKGDIFSFPLFDQSGGIGQLPDKWPQQQSGQYSGYAGGLSPDNLEEELEKISRVALGGKPIWIDAETKLRSKEDTLFDLAKVRRFLEVAKPWVIGY